MHTSPTAGTLATSRGVCSQFRSRATSLSSPIVTEEPRKLDAWIGVTLARRLCRSHWKAKDAHTLVQHMADLWRPLENHGG